MKDFISVDEWKASRGVSSAVSTDFVSVDEWKRGRTSSQSSFTPDKKSPAFSKDDPGILLDILASLIPGGQHTKETIMQQQEFKKKNDLKGAIEYTMKRKEEAPAAVGKDIFQFIKSIPSFTFGTPIKTAAEAVGVSKDPSWDWGPLGEVTSAQEQKRQLKQAGAGEVVSTVAPYGGMILGALGGKALIKKGYRVGVKGEPIFPEKPGQSKTGTALLEEQKRSQGRKSGQQSYTENITDPREIVNTFREHHITNSDVPQKRLSKDKAYNEWVDENSSLYEITDSLSDLPLTERIQYRVKKILGAGSKTLNTIEYHTSRFNSKTGETEITGEGLKPILKELNPEMRRDVWDLMVAESSIERGARGQATINLKDAKNTVGALKQIHGENYGQLDAAAQRIRAWMIRAQLDPLVEVGILDKTAYSRIVNAHQKYAPLFRALEKVDEQLGRPLFKKAERMVKGNPLRKAKGSEMKVVDPLETALRQTERIQTLVERTRLTNYLVEMAARNPHLKGFVEKAQLKMRPVARETMTAEYDPAFMEQLITFAKKHGLKEFETKGRAGKVLGYYTPALKKIVRKFATSSKTSAHEVGHHLDAVFGLVQKRFLARKIKNRPLVEEMAKFMKDQGQSRSRILNPKERFAHAFEWWLIHRDLAARDLPLFSAEMRKILNSNPSLRPLANIRPTPGADVEMMSKTLFRPEKFNLEPDVVVTWENGKPSYWKIKKEWAETIKRPLESSLFSAEELSFAEKLVYYPARMVRAGSTLAGEFILRNPLKDIWTAKHNAKYGISARDWVEGLFHAIKKDELFQKWQREGGDLGHMTASDRAAWTRNITEVLGENKARNFLKNPFVGTLKILQDVSSTLEKSTRIGVFKRALKEKAPVIEAIYQSREATIDFGRTGTLARTINKMIPFFTASIQGTNKMIRTFRNPATRGKALFTAATTLTVPSITLWFINKDNPRYQELPQYVKDQNWVIDLTEIKRLSGEIGPGEEWPLLKIPKPFEYGAIFATSTEHFLDFLAKEDPDALTTYFSYLMQTSTPGVVPAALTPLLEVGGNRSFFTKRPLKSQGEEKLPAEYQYNERTSEIAKLLGKETGLSPIDIQHIFEGYTSTLGRGALFAVDQFFKDKNIPRPTLELGELPLVKAFIAKEPLGSTSASVMEFYKEKTEASAAKSVVRKLLKEGRPDEAREYIKKHPEFAYSSGLDSMASTFSDMRELKAQIYASKTMTPKQKKEALTMIDEKMTLMANRILKVIKARRGGDEK